MELKNQKVVIVGQGYVGLPVAMRAVEVGYSVVGLDLDGTRIESLRRGISYVDDVSEKQLRDAISSGRYLASDSYDDALGFDIAVITVPTPLKESLPDLTFIEASSRELAPHIRLGSTVVLESTTYPGTTEELLVPILEAGSKLTAGVDFHVGYSPERIDPGNPTWGFVETPKVVSGFSPSCLERIQGFYDDLVVRTVPVSSPKEAELTKLLENTFRHVNIALVNELAIFAHQLGVNVWESIAAASTKPFGFMKFTPGPGVGGHCLPVDPSYLSWQVRRKLGQNFRFVELANDINDNMPAYVVQRIMEMLNEQGKPVRDSRILLMGLAYKKNTGDIREAPSLRVAELLYDLGGNVRGVDDHVEAHKWPRTVVKVDFSEETIADSDIVVLLTDHDEFSYELLESDSSLILDTQNRITGEKVVRL